MLTQDEIAARLAAVRDRMERAACRAQRDVTAVRLVLASKTQPPDAIRAAYACGANGAHEVPEGGVVGVASAVVADRSANVFRDIGQAAYQIVYRLGGQIGMAGQGGVQVGDVGLVMLVVVDLHGFRIDKRLERGVVVRKRWKFVSHLGKSPSFEIVL